MSTCRPHKAVGQPPRCTEALELRPEVNTGDKFGPDLTVLQLWPKVASPVINTCGVRTGSCDLGKWRYARGWPHIIQVPYAGQV